MTTATNPKVSQSSTSRIMAGAAELLQALQALRGRREVLRDWRDQSVQSVLRDQGWTSWIFLQWNITALSLETSSMPSSMTTRASRAPRVTDPTDPIGPRDLRGPQTRNGTESDEARRVPSLLVAARSVVLCTIDKGKPGSHQEMPRATDQRHHPILSMRSHIQSQEDEPAP